MYEDNLESKIQHDLDNFRNIQKMTDKLKKDRLLLVSKNKNHPLIAEIDKQLYKYGLLCNQVYQMNITNEEMTRKIEKYWRPFLDEKRIGCGLNVLSFLGIITKKSARAKLTCLNVDAGFPMAQIKDIIVKQKKISHSFEVNKIAFNAENLKTFIFDQMANENATLVRMYTSNSSIMGHTMILYRVGNHLYLLDPQQEVYAEVIYHGHSKSFELVPMMNRPMDDNHTHIMKFVNSSVSIEFFTTNEKMEVVRPPKKLPTFEPMFMTEETPFHMFLMVSHGLSVYEDKHKENITFPFHSMGFFIEKNITLVPSTSMENLTMTDIIEEVSDSMGRVIPEMNKESTRVGDITKPKLSDVLVNTTGQLSVYPMYWTVHLSDYPATKEVIGFYHLIYNKETNNFDIVSKIYGYNFFLDKSTGNPRKLYYGDIVRTFDKYYSYNKNKYFTYIPRELIFMGIFSCRTPDPAYINSSPEIVSSETPQPPKNNNTADEAAENVKNFKRFFGDITRKGGFIDSEDSQSEVDIEMVSQDKLFEYARQEQKQMQSQMMKYKYKKTRKRRNTTNLKTRSKTKSKTRRRNIQSV